MRTGLIGGILLLLFVVFVIGRGSIYTVDETKQVLLTEFGEVVGEPVTDAGLHFKKPFIQEANQIEKRVLEWDGHPKEMPTKDKTYIVVDTFGRWSIQDPRQYFEKLRDERSARSRLDDILGSETRNAIARHELIEVVRSDKSRGTVAAADLAEGEEEPVSKLYTIRRGRSAIEKDIFDAAKPKLAAFGIKLLDVRFKRINYNETVQQRIYDRMKSERQQIAERFRSEGEGEAAKILGNKEKDLRKVESEAYKEIQRIQGEADAKATEIYAKAYNQSSEAAELYRFLKSLETYKEVFAEDTTLLLSTKSDLFEYLNDIEGEAKPPAPSPPAPAPRPARIPGLPPGVVPE